MRLGGKDNLGNPWSMTFLYPTVIQQILDLLHDDLGLVISVRLVYALHRFGVTGINTKFKTKDGPTNANFAETIPIHDDNVCNGGSICRGNRIMEREAFIKLFLVNRRIKGDDIIASRYFGSVFFRTEETSAAMTLIIKVAVVNVVSKLRRLPSANDARTPNLWGCLNSKTWLRKSDC
jgi:hypothetical protein